MMLIDRPFSSFTTRELILYYEAEKQGMLSLSADELLELKKELVGRHPDIKTVSGLLEILQNLNLTEGESGENNHGWRNL